MFDGKRGGYKEDDSKSPATFYGKTKLISENDIQGSLQHYLICRSANIYGRGGNFFNFLYERLLENKEIEAFDDVLYTPTYIDYLSDSLCLLLVKQFQGIIHVTGKEVTSRYHFALKMAETFGKDPALIIPVKQPEGGLIAANSSLDSTRVRDLLKNFSPPIEKSLHYCFHTLISPYFYY